MTVELQLGIAIGMAIQIVLERTVFVSLAHRLNSRRRTVRIRGR